MTPLVTVLLIAFQVFLLAMGVNLVVENPNGLAGLIGSVMLGLFVASLYWGIDP